MHWTLRSVVKVSGLAPSTIHGTWREHGLKSHPAKAADEEGWATTMTHDY